MAEKKLSEELRHCLEDDSCGDCQYHERETKLICEGLLQKAYEVVKRYEEEELKRKKSLMEILKGYERQKSPRKLESEEKSMLHNVTVKVEENKVLETYWTIRGGIKGNSLLRPYHELDHEPTPEEIAQFIYRNEVDFAFVEKDYRFAIELPFC